MRTTLVVAPTAEPLILEEVQDHLRADFDEEVAYLTRLIVAAREAFEKKTGMQLMTATWSGFLDRFPWYHTEPIRLAKPPTQSVTSVSYIDSSGVSQVWSASEYTVQTFAGSSPQRGMISPKPDFLYPTTRRVPNAVTIDFVAGYQSADDVPADIKYALLAWIGHHYENRESVIVGQTATMVPALGFDPWIDHDFG